MRKTKKRKAIIVRPTARCGANENDFEGTGSVTLPGGQLQAAEMQAISMAEGQAQLLANAWIGSMVCPARCFLKSSSVQNVDVDSESEFIKVGANGYSLANARVVVRARIRCDNRPRRDN